MSEMDPWSSARTGILNTSGLSSTERQCLDKTTKEQLFADLKDLDEKHVSKSNTRSIAGRMAPLINSIWQYSGALNAISNMQSMPMPPIWGSNQNGPPSKLE